MGNFLLKDIEIKERKIVDNFPMHQGSKYEDLSITLEFTSNGNTSTISNLEILEAIRNLLNEFNP